MLGKDQGRIEEENGVGRKHTSIFPSRIYEVRGVARRRQRRSRVLSGLVRHGTESGPTRRFIVWFYNDGDGHNEGKERRHSTVACWLKVSKLRSIISGARADFPDGRQRKIERRTTRNISVSGRRVLSSLAMFRLCLWPSEKRETLNGVFKTEPCRANPMLGTKYSMSQNDGHIREVETLTSKHDPRVYTCGSFRRRFIHSSFADDPDNSHRNNEANLIKALAAR
ncbi:hypothetical protein ARMSODRAFT_1009264 [Armillaria solidipes]|uniref:Uncharacterized protein n=1 Tax=Armillaria solidipes TaxID=1076256 RepID=A0A2H3B7J6_9AGAR|nr:hypothetical protein ARMSODRAFT_1009264 [Armillaria solidipes]